MGNVLSALQPSLLWKHFEALSECPRPSKKEEKVVRYVLDFLNSKQMDYSVDGVGNIIVRIPATPGYEDRKTIILQGHLDMVCEMNKGTEHDFDNDPIKLQVKGDWVTATGTTLGADNGIGVAAALAISEDPTIEHGPLEILMTLDEETGMTGAAGLDASLLKGTIMLNLDSEEDGAFYIGCSGGIDTQASFPITRSAQYPDAEVLEVSVTGFKGGHSGLEIHLQKGNAIKQLSRFLLNRYKAGNVFGLISLEGGSKRNAIPREAFATIIVPKSDIATWSEAAKNFFTKLSNEFGNVEPDVKVTVAQTTTELGVISDAQTLTIVRALASQHHGVVKMSYDIPELVETSTNLAIVHTAENSIDVATSQRSSVDSEKRDIQQRVAAIFELAGASVTQGDGYPGWQPDVHSEILGVAKTTFKDLFGSEPHIKAIHAGLECGIIKEKYPSIDMLSFGPTITGAHSPDEQVNVPTVEKFWNLLTAVIKNVPKK